MFSLISQLAREETMHKVNRQGDNQRKTFIYIYIILYNATLFYIHIYIIYRYIYIYIT